MDKNKHALIKLPTRLQIDQAAKLYRIKDVKDIFEKPGYMEGKLTEYTEMVSSVTCHQRMSSSLSNTSSTQVRNSLAYLIANAVRLLQHGAKF